MKVGVGGWGGVGLERHMFPGEAPHLRVKLGPTGGCVRVVRLQKRR